MLKAGIGNSSQTLNSVKWVSSRYDLPVAIALSIEMARGVSNKKPYLMIDIPKILEALLSTQSDKQLIAYKIVLSWLKKHLF